MYNAVETEVKNNPDNLKAKELLDKGIKGFSHANCFSGDTEYLTDNGVKTLKDTLHQQVKVLGINGAWTDATIEYFGKQEIVKLILIHEDKTKIIKTTENHRWLKIIDGEQVEITTKQLQKGDKLQSMYEGLNGLISEYEVYAVHLTGDIEDVYCAVVPEGSAFTLESNIVTRNCSGICVKGGNTHYATLYAVYPDRYNYIENLEKEINEKQMAKNGRRYTILSKLVPTDELDAKGKLKKKKVPYSLEEYRIEILEGDLNKEVELEVDPITCECVF